METIKQCLQMINDNMITFLFMISSVIFICVIIFQITKWLINFIKKT